MIIVSGRESKYITKNAVIISETNIQEACTTVMDVILAYTHAISTSSTTSHVPVHQKKNMASFLYVPLKRRPQ